jgi:hypothetical protein
MPDRDRNDWAYRKAAEKARQETPYCLCGRPIDPTLPRDRADSASADHYTLPVALGGDLLGPLRGMHRVCNMRKGTNPITPGLITYLASKPLEWDTPRMSKRRPKSSRDW